MIARLTRATLLQTVHEDYIRTARSKGLHERMVIVRHALKNSLIPVVTIHGPRQRSPQPGRDRFGRTAHCLLLW